VTTLGGETVVRKISEEATGQTWVPHVILHVASVLTTTTTAIPTEGWDAIYEAAIGSPLVVCPRATNGHQTGTADPAIDP
jgi:hypothetical protein